MYNPLNPPSVEFSSQPSADTIKANVRAALDEDLGPDGLAGDATAALIDPDATCSATVISREPATLCGTAWFDAVFAALSPDVQCSWNVQDGARVRPEQVLVTVTGPARPVLAGERSALNFLQLLSAVATETQRYVDRVKGTSTQIVDTRKTIPGLRMAQKYAVACGGGVNHRIGLFDAVMVKENHIAAAGGLAAAIMAARQAPSGATTPVIAEAEDLAQVEQALSVPAPPEILLLDNFATHLLARAVNMVAEQRRAAARFGASRATTLLEASGNVSYNTVRDIADTGVDRISIGGLTKNVSAIDLSMRVDGS